MAEVGTAAAVREEVARAAVAREVVRAAVGLAVVARVAVRWVAGGSAAAAMEAATTVGEVMAAAAMEAAVMAAAAWAVATRVVVPMAVVGSEVAARAAAAREAVARAAATVVAVLVEAGWAADALVVAGLDQGTKAMAAGVAMAPGSMDLAAAALRAAAVTAEEMVVEVMGLGSAEPAAVAGSVQDCLGLAAVLRVDHRSLAGVRSDERFFAVRRSSGLRATPTALPRLRMQAAPPAASMASGLAAWPAVALAPPAAAAKRYPVCVCESCDAAPSAKQRGGGVRGSLTVVKRFSSNRGSHTFPLSE